MHVHCLHVPSATRGPFAVTNLDRSACNAGTASPTATTCPATFAMWSFTMRLRPAVSGLPVPSPTRLVLAIVVLAFVSCELARSTAHADAGARDDYEARRTDVDPSVRVVVRGPSIAAVLQAAYRAAGLDRDVSRGWIRRARLAGLIPSVTVRTGRDASWQSDDVAVDHDMAIDVRATWRLDRLAFDGRELQAASIEAARRRERRNLARRVIRVYFAWQRAARSTYRGAEVDGSADAPPDASTGLADTSTKSATQVSTRSRALEAAAELDALTDGWFSESLGGSRRTASGGRTR